MGAKYSQILPPDAETAGPRLYLGPIDYVLQPSVLTELGVTAICSVLPAPPPEVIDLLKSGQIAKAHHFPLDDAFLAHVNFSAGNDAGIITACQFIRACLRDNHSIIVHCDSGLQRSAAVVISYLMMYGNGRCSTMSFGDAQSFVIARRPNINAGPLARALISFGERHPEGLDPDTDYPPPTVIPTQPQNVDPRYKTLRASWETLVPLLLASGQRATASSTPSESLDTRVPSLSPGVAMHVDVPSTGTPSVPGGALAKPPTSPPSPSGVPTSPSRTRGADIARDSVVAERALGAQFYSRWLGRADASVRRMFIGIDMNRQHEMFMAQIRAMLYGSIDQHAQSLAFKHAHLPITVSDLRTCYAALVETVFIAAGETWEARYRASWVWFFESLFKELNERLAEVLGHSTEPFSLSDIAICGHPDGDSAMAVGGPGVLSGGAPQLDAAPFAAAARSSLSALGITSSSPGTRGDAPDVALVDVRTPTLGGLPASRFRPRTAPGAAPQTTAAVDGTAPAQGAPGAALLSGAVWSTPPVKSGRPKGLSVMAPTPASPAGQRVCPFSGAIFPAAPTPGMAMRGFGHPPVDVPGSCGPLPPPVSPGVVSSIVTNSVTAPPNDKPSSPDLTATPLTTTIPNAVVPKSALTPQLPAAGGAGGASPSAFAAALAAQPAALGATASGHGAATCGPAGGGCTTSSSGTPGSSGGTPVGVAHPQTAAAADDKAAKKAAKRPPGLALP